jgi:hypothetical protein
MRSEILTRIQALLLQDDLEAIRQDVRSAMDEFRALTTDEVRQQREAWATSEKEPDAVFEYEASPEEQAFEELITTFKEREKLWRKQVAESQKANLEKKLAMLEQLRQTIQEEENIGAAFAVFNGVRVEWDAVGDVPGDQFKIVHDQYYRLRDEFFYNINIYKELKEHDLKVNLKKKEALLADAKALESIEGIREREKQARAIQKQWLDVGPSPRENYQELSDQFFGIIRPIFEEVKSHFDELRASFTAHAEAKESLIEQLREVVAEEVEANHAGWQAATTKIIALQTAWKTTGFAGKDQNEALWGKFRELADVFFQKKQLFYDAQKSVGKQNKQEKQSLLEQAEATAESTDWKTAVPKMMALQKAWKDVGPCPPSEEQRLFRRFRKIQDQFFTARKAEFAGRDAEEKANLEAKEALLKELESFKLSGDRKADLDSLKDFSSRWNKVGFVPRKAMDSVMERYRAAMDASYDSLSAQRSERAVETYKQRADHLVSSSPQDVRREQNILREKMDRLKSRVTQTEENLERFTGKGAEAIREQYEKSMEADKREMEEIKTKLVLLRQASQQETKSEDTPS